MGPRLTLLQSSFSLQVLPISNFRYDSQDSQSTSLFLFHAQEISFEKDPFDIVAGGFKLTSVSFIAPTYCSFLYADDMIRPNSHNYETVQPTNPSPLQTDAAVENAVKLDGSEFKGRNLIVTHKRVNVAGFGQQQAYDPSGGRGGRGRGGRGGRGYRGGFRGGGGRGGRGRGRGAQYHPYY